MEPVRIVPGMLAEPRHDGAGVWPEFRAETVRIGLQRQNVVLRAENLVFVNDAFGKFGHEEFPDAGGAARPHGIYAAVPAVEISDDADAPRIGSPNGEVNAGYAFKRFYMSAQFFVGIVVAAFAHQVEIEFREQVGGRVSVVRFPNVAVLVAKTQAIARRRWSEIAGERECRFEKTRVAQLSQRDGVGLALQ